MRRQSIFKLAKYSAAASIILFWIATLPLGALIFALQNDGSSKLGPDELLEKAARSWPDFYWFSALYTLPLLPYFITAHLSTATKKWQVFISILLLFAIERLMAAVAWFEMSINGGNNYFPQYDWLSIFTPVLMVVSPVLGFYALSMLRYLRK